MKIWKVTHGYTASWGKFQSFAISRNEVIKDMLSIIARELKLS